MIGSLKDYLADGPPVPDPDYAGQQRIALQDLLRLSPEQVGPAEALIESQYEAAKKDVQGQFEGDERVLEVNFRPQSDQIERRHQVETKAIVTRFNGQVRSINAHVEQKRQEAMRLFTERHQRAAEQRKDQVMEAEFLVDGTLEKAKQKRRLAQAAFQAARQRLEALRLEADQRLRLYREPVPAWDTQPADAAAQEGRPARARHVQEALARRHLETLQHLRAARLFTGAWPVVIVGGSVMVVLSLVALPYALGVTGLPSPGVTGAVALIATLAALGLFGWTLWRKTRRQIGAATRGLQSAVGLAGAALEQQHRVAQHLIEQRYGTSLKEGKAELRDVRQTFEAMESQLLQERQTALAAIERASKETLERLSHERDAALQAAERQYQQDRAKLDSWIQEEKADLQRRREEASAKAEQDHHQALGSLHDRWDKALARIDSMVKATAALDPKATGDLNTCNEAWAPQGRMPGVVRYGTWQVDLGHVAGSVRQHAGSRVLGYGPVALPAVLALPGRGSLLIEHEREGRSAAVGALRAVMVRLFACLPPGRVRFTLIDPLGLGESFAGFMHAGDYRESLVGGRIWTEVSEIQQQLEDLTNHMEDVIQKYLRNEFESIEQYNQQAGPLAEPYRFLVIADFPNHFNEESARRLASIVHSGPRCGVHTLIAYDRRQGLPQGLDLKDLSGAGVYLVHETEASGTGRFVCQDAALKPFPLVLDRPPSDKVLTQIMHSVGRASVDAARVEVPFESIAPAESKIWSLDSRQELRVPIGHTGATRWQVVTLGRGVAQHMLIAGKTGSGKSTLLHVIVTNLGLWYSPDEVELYLIDFKKGVEFKTYVTHRLPHARAVAIESDREFGLSILERLGAEMTRRGELFRAAGVQDIAAYRDATSQVLARIVLIVDEFQVFFSEDDKLAQDAAIGLEQLVRQGRAFGIHVILGSQTLGGAFGLARSTMGQMAVRIALQCSEADSQLILDDENVAARRLSRPGEAIYNDAGGQVVGNSPFQTAWLSEATRDRYLGQVLARASQGPQARPAMVVFEGNAPADLADNPTLAAYLHQDRVLSEGDPPQVWLGSPVAISGPTAAVLRRQSGANVLIIGQREDLAMELMAAGLIGLAAQLGPGQVRFAIFDGSPAGSAQSQLLRRITSVLTHTHRMVSFREAPDVMAEMSAEADRRVQADDIKAPCLIVFLYAMQRYPAFRRTEDAFGFSPDDQAKASPNAALVNLLRTGPSVGVHVLAWADTLASVERILDRQTLREFDYRVLFQMSAADSSNLIDSPSANQLGFHRAILYSQEQGGLEKFRPYAVIRDEWLAEVATRLAGRKESRQ